MYSSSTDSLSKGLSTTLTIIAVVCAVGGLIFCIGLVVIVVCVIKHFNKRNSSIGNGMVLQPYSYPPNPNYIPNPNYPPAYAPPYTFTEPEFNKVPPPQE
jgi:hypothetical protein